MDEWEMRSHVVRSMFMAHVQHMEALVDSNFIEARAPLPQCLCCSGSSECSHAAVRRGPAPSELVAHNMREIGNLRGVGHLNLCSALLQGMHMGAQSQDLIGMLVRVWMAGT